MSIHAKISQTGRTRCFTSHYDQEDRATWDHCSRCWILGGEGGDNCTQERLSVNSINFLES